MYLNVCEGQLKAVLKVRMPLLKKQILCCRSDATVGAGLEASSSIMLSTAAYFY